jgi:hypothetical protein
LVPIGKVLGVSFSATSGSFTISRILPATNSAAVSFAALSETMSP